MGKKIITVILIILLTIIILGVTFFLVDKNRVEKNEEPIFIRVVNVHISDSVISGYEEYIGLGYKILKVKIAENEYYTKVMPVWKEPDLTEPLKMIEERTSRYKDDYGYTKLENLPENYSVDKATKDGCVIISYNKILNKEKLERFIENTKINSQSRKEDKVRIIQFTTEGDMIIKDLEYRVANDNQNVQKANYILTVDNTRDKFSADEDRKITVNEDIPGSCYGIIKNENDDVVTIELALYAEILYKDANSKIYNNIEICSYPKKLETVNN